MTALFTVQTIVDRIQEDDALHWMAGPVAA